MTKKGYHTIIIREDVYNILVKLANEENVSIWKIVEKALNSFLKDKEK